MDSSPLFLTPHRAAPPAFICVTEYPSEWDFFWNELIWKLLSYKQFSSATKNTILSSSKIRGFDFLFVHFYFGLYGPKSILPHCLQRGKSDRTRGHLRVAFTESFRKVLSHLVFLLQQSLQGDVFSRSWTGGDLSSYRSQLQCYRCWQSSTCSLVVYHE